MPYQQLIRTANPGLIVMVLDDSASMKDSLPGSSDEKYKWVERYTGLILKELLAKSTDVHNDTALVKPRYYLYTIIYGNSSKVWPDGATEESDIEKVIQAFANGKNSLGLGGEMNGTNARDAFDLAYQYLSSAVKKDRFKDSFPPMVFHLTDGESQTDASQAAESIKQLSTSDGNVLVVNAFIGTSTSLNYSGPEDFPGYQTEAEAGPTAYSTRLFRMCSTSPKTIHSNLVNEGIFPAFRDGTRLYFDVRTREMLKHVIQVVGSGGSK